MNEHGFFNIFALCLLLVISLSIRTIQDTEKNYSYGTDNFQSELELQNAAESALIETAEKIQSGEIIVDAPTSVESMMGRKYGQRKIPVTQPEKSERLGNISVEVYGERGKISEYVRKYSGEENYKDYLQEKNKFGVILISVASCDDKIVGVKKFRRSLAYILDDDKSKIFFMNDAERGEIKK